MSQFRCNDFIFEFQKKGNVATNLGAEWPWDACIMRIWNWRKQ